MICRQCAFKDSEANCPSAGKLAVASLDLSGAIHMGGDKSERGCGRFMDDPGPGNKKPNGPLVLFILIADLYLPRSLSFSLLAREIAGLTQARA